MEKKVYNIGYFVISLITSAYAGFFCRVPNFELSARLYEARAEWRKDVIFNLYQNTPLFSFQYFDYNYRVAIGMFIIFIALFFLIEYIKWKFKK